MKKLLSFFLALPLLAFMAACNDDDDTPQVEISFTYSGAVVSDGAVYVVKPDTLVVESVNVVPVRQGHKATCTGPVNYWLNGYPLATSFIAPYGVRIPTDGLDVGAYKLSANMGIAEEGYALATALVSVQINVVADSTDIPQPATGLTNEMPVPHTFQ